MRNRTLRFTAAIIFLSACAVALFRFPAASESNAEFPFKPNDRVAWIGSSSTRIGTWCRTMEFLLRTRHPELKLTFNRGTSGGGTFSTGIKNLPAWLGDFKPTYVLYNYGGNDATAGLKGIPQFKLNMQKCLEMAQEAGARAQFITPQAGDTRVAPPLPFAMRKTYAETMLEYAREKNWTVYNTHTPLEDLQTGAANELPDFTINKDRIHLTDSAYVAWGFYLYERMNPPMVESAAELTADGKIASQTGCKISAVVSAPGVLEFVREDSALPLLPPDPIPVGNALRPVALPAGNAIGAAVKDEVKPVVIEKPSSTPATPATPVTPATAAVPPAAPVTPGLPAHSAAEVAAGALKSADKTPVPAKQPATAAFKMPPAQAAYIAKNSQNLPARKAVPMEKYSRYMLKVSGLASGNYALSCDGKPVGVATEKEWADGVNMNSLLLDSKNPAPWGDMVKDLWQGKRLDEVGKTQFKFKIEKK